jgi:hypothetical protein
MKTNNPTRCIDFTKEREIEEITKILKQSDPLLVTALLKGIRRLQNKIINNNHEQKLSLAKF